MEVVTNAITPSITTHHPQENVSPLILFAELGTI
jgi:hypothetical protein